MRRWPVHPRPHPDETLTSWFVRLARANGASPSAWHAAAVGRFAPTVDLDTREDEAFWSLLAARTGCGDAAAVRALTLIETIAALGEHAASRWLLSVDRRTRRPKHRWCPRCVATDSEPYIRRAWRMEWVAWCPADGVRLRDACPDCGCALNVRRVSWRASLMSCWQCGRGLGDHRARSEPAPAFVQSAVLAALARVGAGAEAAADFGSVWCLQKWVERLGPERWAELAPAGTFPAKERVWKEGDPSAQAALSFGLAWHLAPERRADLPSLIERFQGAYNRATDARCPPALAAFRRTLQASPKVEVDRVEAVVAARIAADLPVDLEAVARDLGVARDCIARRPGLRGVVTNGARVATTMHHERVRARIVASRERLLARGERLSRAAVAREAGITREEAARWEEVTGETLAMTASAHGEAQVREAVTALRRRGARITVLAVSKEVGRGRTLFERHPRLKAIIREAGEARR